ncbi:hypothetical protein [Pontibacter mangrovi]|uniref:Uncharacterized protein n=1 Tax=Pontibacter mangrovi TaxID=2589816 RepID=A0A501W740_9BACT|nr:hypothetical protein [Pontibacter mangrovi]TPE42647.1 hypothetical protein FJM65_17695 [Pontibacter mangrovi]
MIHILKEYLQLGRSVVISVFITFFFIGISFNRLLLPEAIFTLILFLLAVYGIASFSSLVYWTSSEWSELNKERKSKKILKVAVLALLLTVQIWLVGKVLMIYFRF